MAPNAINVSLFRNLPFDPVADFAPVSLVASTPNILVVHPATPARTVKEVISLARARPTHAALSCGRQGTPLCYAYPRQEDDAR